MYSLQGPRTGINNLTFVHFIFQGGFDTGVQEAGVVIIGRGFRHALKNVVADLLNANHAPIH